MNHHKPDNILPLASTLSPEGFLSEALHRAGANLAGHPGAADHSHTVIPEEEEPTGIRIRLGTRKKTGEPLYWTPEDLRQTEAPNIAIVGGEDTGSTQMLQSVAIQLMRQKAQAHEPMGFLIFSGLDDDSEARATFAEAAGAKLLRLYKLPLNPFCLRFLERKPQLHTHTAIVFADALALAYGLGTLAKSTLVQCILAAYEKRGITSDPLTWDLNAPTFADVYTEYRSRPQNQHSDALEQVMESLSLLDLFDPDIQEETSLFHRLQGTVILDMSGYPAALKHFALTILLETLFAQMRGSVRTPSRGLQKMVLIDNAGYLLENGSPGLEGLLTQGMEFGLGVLLTARSLEVFRTANIDYRPRIRTWMLHNAADLRKTDLEYLLQMDISDGDLARLYQESRHLPKLHSLICISDGEPVLAEDLPFYQIAGDTAQSYLIQTHTAPEPEPLAGMPLLDAISPDALVTLEDISGGSMAALEELD